MFTFVIFQPTDIMRAAVRLLLLVYSFLSRNELNAQKNSTVNNLIYVDRQGILRWTKDNKEASFFGVNYTTPFAYAYRAHNALNVDIEKAIRRDVYQLARLGMDAFRVHIWDTEISDTTGNLIENDHLRLFDFSYTKLTYIADPDHPDWKMTGTESVSIPGIRGNYYGGALGALIPL